jgi:hypothetical protein
LPSFEPTTASTTSQESIYDNNKYYTRSAARLANNFMSVPYYSSAQKNSERNFLNRHNREFEQEDALDYWAISAVTVDFSEAEYFTYNDCDSGLMTCSTASDTEAGDVVPTTLQGADARLGGRDGQTGNDAGLDDNLVWYDLDGATRTIKRYPGHLDPDEGLLPIDVSSTDSSSTGTDGTSSTDTINTFANQDNPAPNPAGCNTLQSASGSGGGASMGSALYYNCKDGLRPTDSYYKHMHPTKSTAFESFDIELNYQAYNNRKASDFFERTATAYALKALDYSSANAVNGS